MIDPATLRPGRLDVKIRIERPDADAGRDIFGKYLTSALPFHESELAKHDGDADATAEALIDAAVGELYARDDAHAYLEATYADGSRETLYFADFASGAMIQNIVDRAKKFAIKALITNGERGITREFVLAACHDEFRENEDLPGTSNPDDWARISGRRGERIVDIRTLADKN